MILKELHSIESKADKLKFICEKGTRAEIIREKKAMPKNSDNLLYYPSAFNSIKYAPQGVNIKDGQVMIVGNSCGIMDSHDDVSMLGSWTKTVKERGNIVPILKDHNYTVDSAFAKNLGASIQTVPILQIGYEKQGSTEVVTALIEPDKEMLYKYENGIIKEHSVGLQYIKIGFAVNDESEEEGYKEWIASIDKVINRERAEELGYFFPIYEQKLIEFSAVVFGSNPYTPAFTNTKESLETIEPLENTPEVKPIHQGNEFLKHLIY